MIVLNVTCDYDTIASQFFDYFYAYRQAQHSHYQYSADVEIKFNQPVTDHDINILVVDLEKCFAYRDCYDFDLIIIDNRAESLETSSYMVYAMLEQHPRAYLLCGSLLHREHACHNKIISYNTDLHFFSDCITRPFYPQHWQTKLRTPTDRLPLCVINGQNTTWRMFFLTCLQKVTTNLPVRSSIKARGHHARKLRDCAFETTHDQTFRTWLNSHIQHVDLDQEDQIDYYASSIDIGINQKFGRVPPGYFLLDEYYDYHCVIYPEAAWINHQLFMTEKTFKCLASHAIPWPISGAYCHAMMEELGIRTARELLPESLQQFDRMEDHELRYRSQCQAIAWAEQHPEIWSSNQANSIRQNNFEKFYQNSINMPGVEKFNNLIQQINRD